MIAAKPRPTKVALLLEGGGMRAGFVAGALLAMMDHGIVRFDQALAVSASVPTLAYFLAGQRREMEAVWRTELCTPKLVCYRNLPAASLFPDVRRPVLDIDYLVNDVFMKRYPMDRDRLERTHTRIYFAAVRVPEGRVEFLEPGQGDIYPILKACMAVPGCYPDPVTLNSGEYMDGGAVNPLPASLVFDGDGVRTLAILTKPLDCDSEPPLMLERALFWRYFRRHEWMLEALWEAVQAYGEEVSRLEKLARSSPPRALILAPDRTPPARFITRDRRKVNRTIDMGYQKAVERMDELRAFMEGPE